MTNKPTIRFCVYCGSRTGKNADYAALAAELGHAMAQANIGLVYGGGSIGLMGLLSDNVMANGGHVTGIIPDFLDAREVGARDVSDFIIVSTMHERKARMIAEADALIALPGGIGTYDELFEALTWAFLDQHDKPIYLLGPAAYWQPFKDLLAHVHEQGFAWSDPAELLTHLPNVEALIDSAQKLGTNSPKNDGPAN